MMLGMTWPLCVSLLGLGAIALVMIGTTINAIHDQMHTEAQEDRDAWTSPR
jgi:hypothetical protein